MGDFEKPRDYVEVQDRILEFREKYPEGHLSTVRVEVVNVPASYTPPKWKNNKQVPNTGETAAQSYILVVAAAHRNKDDLNPAHGSAWEPIPGRTPYTKDSELQNAETSAWGRALIALGAADAKKGIASANEVRNRQYTNDLPERDVNEDAPKPNRQSDVQRQTAAPTKGRVPANETTPWNTDYKGEFEVGALGKVDLDKLTEAVAKETSKDNLRAWHGDIGKALHANLIDKKTADEAADIIKARAESLG